MASCKQSQNHTMLAKQTCLGTIFGRPTVYHVVPRIHQLVTPQHVATVNCLVHHASNVAGSTQKLYLGTIFRPIGHGTRHANWRVSANIRTVTVCDWCQRSPSPLASRKNTAVPKALKPKRWRASLSRSQRDCVVQWGNVSAVDASTKHPTS